MNTAMLYVIFIAFSFGIFLLGFYLGKGFTSMNEKARGELHFYVEDYDGTDMINCAVKPYGTWEELMRLNRAMFQVTREEKIDQAIRNELKGE